MRRAAAAVALIAAMAATTARPTLSGPSEHGQPQQTYLAALQWPRLFPVRASRSAPRRDPDPLPDAPTPGPAAPPTTNPQRPVEPHRSTGHIPPVPRAASGGAWACIRQHESGGNYRANTGNGYTGAAQWLASTWNAAVRLVGRGEYANGRADLAPPAVQDAAAVAWQAAHGWGPWPQTSRACGLR